MIQWHLESRKIKDLKPHPKNPRRLTKDQALHLEQSLSKFGLIDVPVINTDNMIIGGHQRLNILKKQKIKEIQVWVPDHTLDEREVDELNIRLNRNTGEFDYDILANEWEITDLVEWGFQLEDFEIPADQVESQEVEEDGETLEPGKDEDAITKLGDVYELNGHRLVCGDSTLPEYVEKCLNGNEPILMVTDPPYGVNYDPNWRGEAGKGQKAAGKVQNDDKINWSLAWHLFPGSVAYVWHAGKFCTEVEKSLLEAEYEIISQIIWSKQNFALSRGDYHWQHEPCWYAVKKGHQHNWQGSRKESTLWEIPSMNAFGKSKDEDERTAHSTQKPLECMARPIRNNTAPGEGVYDPFSGSFTTLIACQMLKRNFYGIELSPAYCDMGINRWVKFMKKNDLPYEIKKNGEKIEWIISD